MTTADDITPEEAEAIQKRIEEDGPGMVSFPVYGAALRDRSRLLAALRRREVERDSKDAALTKVCGELLAAKALLARAVTLLREWEKADNVPADFLTFTATRALLAEIEAEHG